MLLKKFIPILIITLFIQQGIRAQEAIAADSTATEKIKLSDEEQIKGLIDQFLEGIQQGDSTIVKETLDMKDIKIQTIGTNRGGTAVLINQTPHNLLTSVAAKKPTDIYREDLLAYHIKIDGALASAWTPYHFYFNDKFSHCGVNSFKFFNNGNGWKIIYLIDTRRRKGCK